MHFAEDWDNVMFAMRFQSDVPHNNHFIVVGCFLKCRRKQSNGVFVVSSEELFICTYDAFGGAQ